MDEAILGKSSLTLPLSSLQIYDQAQLKSAKSDPDEQNPPTELYTHKQS